MSRVTSRSLIRPDQPQPRPIIDVLLCAVPAVATVILLVVALRG